MEGVRSLQEDYRVVVHLKTEVDPDDPHEWSGLPRSINDHNEDPIPAKTAPKGWHKEKEYKLLNFLMGRVECLVNRFNLKL